MLTIKKINLILLVGFFYSMSSFSESADNETEIVCIAAKNQWVCAPKDKLNVAESKAKKLIEETPDETLESDVVITTVQPLNFEPQNNSRPSNRDFLPKSQVDLIENANKEVDQPVQNQSQNISADEKKISPKDYQNLWSYQLIGVSTVNNAVKYLREKQINKSEVLIVETKRNNQDWWVVLFKLYKDKETGLQDNSNLPKNINKPWLRPLADLNIISFVEDF